MNAEKSFAEFKVNCLKPLAGLQQDKALKVRHSHALENNFNDHVSLGLWSKAGEIYPPL